MFHSRARAGSLSGRYRAGLLLLALLLPLSLSRGSRSPAFPAQSDRIDIERTGARVDLDTFIADTMKGQHIPGLAAIVIKNDQVVFDKGYGFATISSGVRATPDTTFLIASCSKTLGAVSLMQLYDQNKFELDDDINKYLTTVPLNARNPSFPQTPITFRQLLTHTSSLSMNIPDSYGSYAPGDPTVTLAQLFSSYFTSPSNFVAGAAPGAQYQYSNSGSALWAYMAEVISGQLFYQFSKQNLIDKLGMTNTSWRLSDFPDPSTLATLYDDDTRTGSPVVAPAYSFVDYPSGSIRTSANQLAKFLQMFMNGGTYNNIQILKPTTVAEMEKRPVPQRDRENSQALAWQYQRLDDGTEVLGHEGEEKGSGCYMFFRPSDKTGVIILWNKRDGSERVGEDIGEELFQYASTLPGTPATGTSTGSSNSPQPGRPVAGTAAGSPTLTSSQNPSALGQPVTFTASLVCAFPPTGTMTFSDGGAPLATLPMQGAAARFTTAGLAPGSHNVVAAYSGDSNCAFAVSPPLLQLVSGGASPGRAGPTAPIPTPCSIPNARGSCGPPAIGGSGAGDAGVPGR